MPIPTQVLVSWQAVGGASHQRVVNVLDKAGPNFSGDIRFRILPDGSVALRLEPHGFAVKK
jgi:hypothetical protein